MINVSSIAKKTQSDTMKTIVIRRVENVWVFFSSTMWIAHFMNGEWMTATGEVDTKLDWHSWNVSSIIDEGWRKMNKKITIKIIKYWKLEVDSKVFYPIKYLSDNEPTAIHWMVEWLNVYVLVYWGYIVSAECGCVMLLRTVLMKQNQIINNKYWIPPN